MPSTTSGGTTRPRWEEGHGKVRRAGGLLLQSTCAHVGWLGPAGRGQRRWPSSILPHILPDSWPNLPHRSTKFESLLLVPTPQSRGDECSQAGDLEFGPMALPFAMAGPSANRTLCPHPPCQLLPSLVVESSSSLVPLIAFTVTQSLLAVIRTLFLVVILALGVIFVHRDTQLLVLQPIERMMERVKEMAENPLTQATLRQKTPWGSQQSQDGQVRGRVGSATAQNGAGGTPGCFC